MPVRVANPDTAPGADPIGQADTPQPILGSGPGGKAGLGALIG